MTPDHAAALLRRTGLLGRPAGGSVTEIRGGVCATMLAVDVEGRSVIVKQALGHLKIDHLKIPDTWPADARWACETPGPGGAA